MSRHLAFAWHAEKQQHNAAAMEEWLGEKRAAAAAVAQAALQDDVPAEQRLDGWLLARSLDDDPRCQRLAMRLERVLMAAHPALFARAEGWLRRGFAPQVAVVHAVRTLEDPAGAGARLAEWVQTERDVLVSLMRATDSDDGKLAREALYGLRSRHDFHTRILLGVTTPHDVTRLEPPDALLALAIGRVWTALEFEQQGIADALVAFAMHNQAGDPVIADFAQSLDSLTQTHAAAAATHTTGVRP